MRIFQLKPTDRYKSFYGKMCVIEHDDGTKVCKSYDTDVARITPSGKFQRLWDGYSPTTMRHVNRFNEFYGIAEGGKKWWDEQEVVK